MSLEAQKKAIEALKKSRSSYIGAVTRTRNKYLRIAEDSPATYDLGLLQGTLASVERSATACRGVHEKICDYDSDLINLEEEQDISDQYEEGIESDSDLINLEEEQDISDQYEEGRAATNLKSDLVDLEDAKSREPDRDHSAAINQLTTSF